VAGDVTVSGAALVVAEVAEVATNEQTYMVNAEVI